MTPTWHWTLQGERCPIHVIPLSQNPNFQSFALLVIQIIEIFVFPYHSVRFEKFKIKKSFLKNQKIQNFQLFSACQNERLKRLNAGQVTSCGKPCRVELMSPLICSGTIGNRQSLPVSNPPSPTVLRWLILTSYYFFLELWTRCEYKAVLTFTTCFKHLKGVLNILNVFWIFATRLKR